MADNSVKITVTVHKGRGLSSKRHSVCHSSVVFGIGKELYTTEVVESNDPAWKQEAVFELSKPEKETLKIKLKDKDHTVGAVKIPLKSLSSATVTNWYPFEPHKKGSEVTGEVLVQMSTSRPIVSVSEPSEGDSASLGSAKLPSSSAMDEPTTIMSNLKDYFKRATPQTTRQTSKEEDLRMMSSPSHYNSDSQLHLSHSPIKDSNVVSTYTPILSKRSSLSPENVTVSSRSSWRPQSPLYGSHPSDSERNSPSVVSSGGMVLIPEVTGISPKEASIEGGDKVVLRGSNLGSSAEDIIRVSLVNIDCTAYMEYVSSEKLVITTPKTEHACKGPVTVVSSNNGEGKSTVAFTFFDPSEAKSLEPPEITGVSPRSAPVTTSEKITLRGSNLGKSQQDVVLVSLAGVDCTHSMEYISSEKLIVTTFPIATPTSGPVIIETLSGGRSEPSMIFNFVQEAEEGLRRKVASESTLSKAKKDRKEELKQTKRQLRESTRENGVLKEENATLRQYIDAVTLLLMENNPALLSHELLHQPRKVSVETAPDGLIDSDENSDFDADSI